MRQARKGDNGGRPAVFHIFPFKRSVQLLLYTQSDWRANNSSPLPPPYISLYSIAVSQSDLRNRRERGETKLIASSNGREAHISLVRLYYYGSECVVNYLISTKAFSIRKYNNLYIVVSPTRKVFTNSKTNHSFPHISSLLEQRKNKRKIKDSSKVHVAKKRGQLDYSHTHTRLSHVRGATRQRGLQHHSASPRQENARAHGQTIPPQFVPKS